MHVCRKGFNEVTVADATQGHTEIESNMQGSIYPLAKQSLFRRLGMGLGRVTGQKIQRNHM